MTHRRSPIRIAPVAAALLLAGAGVSEASAQATAVSEEQLRAFQPRSIGPAVTGGRVHDIEALPDDPSTIYVATASGGLWKTTNRGHTWVPIFEGQPVSTFGDVAVAPSDPDVVYVGTGEQNNRQSTSWGNGVYRSDDAGVTWRHLGLEETRHVGKIEVHPTDPDVAYVAALGNLWAGSPERGVYRTTDGGETWEKVLAGENEWSGAVDLVMDPSNPDILYAAMYQRLRRTWGFNGGGPGSGIFKTTDGGDTWTELTGGIPSGDKGRIGLAIAASDPDVLNALIEHPEEGGTYRSEDGGESWEKVNEQNIRPMYYSEIFIDPDDPERVYTLATTSHKSEDGGRTFEVIAERPTYDVGVHADHHALWIDPNDPDHLYLGGDAGLYESYDRGRSFRKVNNFAIGQFYAVGVDMRDPYWVYGGMQDNHSWMGPSETRHWAGILNDDWKQIGFGDGMYWQIDPTDPRFAYGNAQNGSWTRVDTYTGDILGIEPAEPEGEEYRYDWVSPSLISSHDPTVVYLGGNRLFVSRDRGESWSRTEDLTRAADRDTLELMGVEGADIAISRNDGTSSYAEITTIAESPLDRGVLWVGTDDGNVQVSRDGGTTWTEVSGNVPGLPGGTYVSRVRASSRGEGVAYATFDAHRDGDFAPYVYRTEDFGRTWTDLSQGLPSGSVNVVVEHPDNPDVLFLGTEHHLFASTDAGASWAKMPNLPTTHYDDLVIHPREKDLVIGTHGRSIWILDDTRPLAEWDARVAAADVHLFPVQPATIFHYWKDTSYRGEEAYAGQNPPDGAIVTYALGPSAGEARLRVEDPGGDVVREMVVPGGSGLHRVNWDLRHGLPDESQEWAPHEDPPLARPVGDRGPFVSPGVYTLTLEAGGASSSQEVEVRGDPEMPLTVAQYREREEFLLDVVAIQQEIEQQLEGLSQGDSQLRDRLGRYDRIADDLYENLNGDGVRQGSLHPPTDTQRQQLQEIRTGLDEARAASSGG